MKRWGLISHVIAGADPQAALRRTVELAQVAEDAGCNSFWLAQHHFYGNRSALPSPLVLLAAVAQATSTIRLGTAIVALSVEQPIRLAEDAATLDALSGERVELGIGPGSDPDASAAFGIDHSRRHLVLEEKLREVIELLEGDKLVPAASGLRNRLWLSTSSERGFALARTLNLGVLLGRRMGPSMIEEERLAGLLGDFAASMPSPRVGLSRPYHCAPSAARAERELRPLLGPWIQDRIAEGKFPAGFDTGDYLGAGYVLAGSALDIQSQLRAVPGFALVSEVLLNVPQAAPDHDLALTSVRRFGASYCATPGLDSLRDKSSPPDSV